MVNKAFLGSRYNSSIGGEHVLVMRGHVYKNMTFILRCTNLSTNESCMFELKTIVHKKTKIPKGNYITNNDSFVSYVEIRFEREGYNVVICDRKSNVKYTMMIDLQVITGCQTLHKLSMPLEYDNRRGLIRKESFESVESSSFDDDVLMFCSGDDVNLSEEEEEVDDSCSISNILDDMDIDVSLSAFDETVVGIPWQYDEIDKWDICIVPHDTIDYHKCFEKL